jgi:Protein of unknown function
MDRQVAEDLVAACERTLESLTVFEGVLRRVTDTDERSQLVRSLGLVIADVLGTLRGPAIHQFPELEPPERLDTPDTELTNDDLVAVSKLKAEEIELIDRTLLQQCAPSWRKVARVVGTAMSALREHLPQVPDSYYAQRVARLVASGLWSPGAISTSCASAKFGYRTGR